jgi:hypothetical protein
MYTTVRAFEDDIFEDIKVPVEIFVPKHTSFKSKRVPRSYLFLGRRFTMVKNGFSQIHSHYPTWSQLHSSRASASFWALSVSIGPTTCLCPSYFHPSLVYVLLLPSLLCQQYDSCTFWGWVQTDDGTWP